MKNEDLKGQLLARRANLQTVAKNNLANVLLTEARLTDQRAELGATHGAIAEIDRTLALIDQPATPAP